MLNDGILCYHFYMNSKHHKTLKAIFTDPLNGNIEWRKIEALFIAMGCEIVEGRGSRISVFFNGSECAFHRPHPNKEALRYRVKDAREFLTEIGVTA